jgi:peptidoglycan hydrolase CwlO-like protein
MDVKYKIENEVLEFEGLSIGNLLTSEKLFWDELRQMVILSSRFATGRLIGDRSLDELKSQAEKIMKQREEVLDEEEKEIAELKRQLHNSSRVIAMLEDRVDELTQESNGWRIQFFEAARTLSEHQKDS